MNVHTSLEGAFTREGEGVLGGESVVGEEGGIGEDVREVDGGLRDDEGLSLDGGVDGLVVLAVEVVEEVVVVVLVVDLVVFVAPAFFVVALGEDGAAFFAVDSDFSFFAGAAASGSDAAAANAGSLKIKM